MPTIRHLREKIEMVEGFGIFIRHKNNINVRSDKMEDYDYPYAKRAPAKWTVKQFIRKRIQPILPGYIILIQNNGKIVHGHVKLSNARPKPSKWLSDLRRSMKRTADEYMSSIQSGRE